MDDKNTLAKSQEYSNPAYLLKLAIENKADITQLKELMDLNDRFLAQKAKTNYLSAISKFQSECPVIKKKKKVSFVSQRTQSKTEYKYAELGDIDEQIKKALFNCGLSKQWKLKDVAENLECTCIISHVDGHSESTVMTAGKDDSGGKNAIQQRGSTITYLQRYTLISALGITTADEDVDGITPVAEVKKETPAPEAVNTNAMTAEDEKQIKEELALLTHEKQVLDYFYQWGKYEKNLIFKGMCQKHIATLPATAKFASEKERKAYKKPNTKKA